MFKKIIPITVLAALPAAAFAGSANVSGFADITYTNDNDTSVFLANAEIDVSNKLSDQVSVRLDTDLSLAGNGGGNAGLSGPADSAVIEQAYFAYTPIKEVTVLGGVFNNPIGWDKEDAPDMYQISKGQIWNILDGQTALYGNNIAGVAVAGGVGPATITVAALNEIGHNDLEKNSYAAVVNVTAVKGLDVELGYVTQEAGAENVLDINATYSMMGATVGLEYLMADKVVDSAMGITLNYQINKMFGATVMYDTVSYEASGTDDTASYAIAVSANLASNLVVAAEYYSTDVSGDDDPKVGLEFIASF